MGASTVQHQKWSMETASTLCFQPPSSNDDDSTWTAGSNVPAKAPETCHQRQDLAKQIARHGTTLLRQVVERFEAFLLLQVLLGVGTLDGPFQTLKIALHVATRLPIVVVAVVLLGDFILLFVVVVGVRGDFILWFVVVVVEIGVQE